MRTENWIFEDWFDLYLEEAILSFHPEIGDPADTDYQRGYLAALVEVNKVWSSKTVPQQTDTRFTTES